MGTTVGVWSDGAGSARKKLFFIFSHTMALSLARRAVGRTNVRAVQSILQCRSYADAPSGSNLSFTFSTPVKSYFNNVNVSQVDVPSGSGNFCILPQHVPIIAVLKPGLMTVAKDGNTEKFFVSSGTITVNNDSSAQILAEEAFPLDQLDLDAARRNADQARQAVGSSADETEKAIAQIQLDTFEALVHALEGK